MLYRIVGIDPGLTTGLVSFAIEDDKISCIESHELDIVGIGDYFSSCVDKNTIVAYEVANKFQASGHLSSEVIGLARYFSLECGSQFIPVTQSSHKKLITRQVLKNSGLLVKGVHARDAAGVAIFTAVTKLNCIQWVLSQGGV